MTPEEREAKAIANETTKLYFAIKKNEYSGWDRRGLHWKEVQAFAFHCVQWAVQEASND